MRLSLAATAFAGLLATLVLAGLAAAAPWMPAPLGQFSWGRAHASFALAGAVLPGLYLLTHLLVQAYLPFRVGRTGDKAALTLGGGAFLGLGSLLQPSGVFALVALAGALLVALGAAQHFLSLRDAIPRASAVDTARDPLTKGDDACLKHLKLGSLFLLLGLLLRAAVLVPFWSAAEWLPRLSLAADHLLLVGYGLPTVYGLSHLAVPRLSGVPAIAAGAIKGELHSTLLGVVLLTAGFLLGWKGPVIAGGVAVFFGAFVFMGVLGANIMKNKSRTQRVTPAFAYIPWTFAGVLWLVCGVLLGLFLNALPSLFAERMPALRQAHAHLVLLGGFVQLGLGFASRAYAPTPVPFARHRLAFWLVNLALAGALAGPLAGQPLWGLLGAVSAILGLAAWFFPLRRHARAVAG